MSENDRTERDEARRLRELPRETRPPEYVRERLRDELRRTGRLMPHDRLGASRAAWWRRARLAAALTATFAAGILVGSGWTDQDRRLAHGPALADLARVPVSSGARVQQLGSEYVEAIATLAHPAASTSAEAAEAQEAAVAAFRGAAEQLALLPVQDPDLRELLNAVRASAGTSEHEGWL